MHETLCLSSKTAFFSNHNAADIFIPDKCFKRAFVCVTVCLCRCFALIDSSTLEQTRDETETDTQTHLESLVELGLSSTVSTILTQCSTEIYKVEHKYVHTVSHIDAHHGAFIQQTEIKTGSDKGPLAVAPHVASIWVKIRALEHAAKTTSNWQYGQKILACTKGIGSLYIIH